jgi:hypothetical protein
MCCIFLKCLHQFYGRRDSDSRHWSLIGCLLDCGHGGGVHTSLLLCRLGKYETKETMKFNIICHRYSNHNALSTLCPNHRHPESSLNKKKHANARTYASKYVQTTVSILHHELTLDKFPCMHMQHASCMLESWLVHNGINCALQLLHTQGHDTCMLQNYCTGKKRIHRKTSITYHDYHILCILHCFNVRMGNLTDIISVSSTHGQNP